MSQEDPDCQAVVIQTDLWLRCAVDGQHQRMDDILSDSFRYSSHPKYGVTEMNKAELMKLAAMLRDDGTEKLDQRCQKIGDMILSTTVTRSMERIDGDLGATASSEAMNDGMNGKILVYVSGWRNEGGAWRCFDMHLTEALGAI